MNSKMNSKVTEAITAVLQSGAMSAPQRESESLRMKHTRIAALFVEEIARRGIRGAKAWPVYEGDKTFSYTIQVGPYVFFLKQ